MTNLKLLKSEATSEADLHVVLLGHAVHDGAKETRDGTGEDLDGLLGAGSAAALLASRLVKPCDNLALPVLAQMHVGEYVVVLHHFDE